MLAVVDRVRAEVYNEADFSVMPEIFAADLDQGFLLIEHLGSEGFLDAGKPVKERYAAAAGLLAMMHGRQWPSRMEAAPGVSHAVPTFDPHLQGNHVTHVWLAYSQLLKAKPGHMARSDGGVEGEIAESWEISPDKLSITMKLTNKAHFSPKPPTNGRAVTMDDVLFSWNRYKTISPRRGELSLAPAAGAATLMT